LISKLSKIAIWLTACVIATAGNTAERSAAYVPTSLASNATLQFTGKLDDPIWQTVPLHDSFWQYKPSDGKPATERTTVQIVFDEKAIYFGIRAYDKIPSEIRAPLVRRDNIFSDQDYINIFLDPVGAKKSAVFVSVNPRGVIADGIYTADTDNLDFSPDFEVDAKTAIHKDGFTAEIRIPYSVLRFPQNSNKPWNFQVTRNVPRAQRLLFVSAPLLATSSSQLDEMTAITGLNTAPVGKTWSLRPSLTVRQNRESAKGQALTIKNKIDPGLDIKWRPSAEWVIDATLRPDFSQVELDVPQLTSNAQFAISLPEKRPFFLESSDILESPARSQEQGGIGNYAIYTRSMTSPLWGLRASNRSENTEAMLLTTHDQGGGSLLIPGAYGSRYLTQPASEVQLARVRTYVDTLSLGGIASRRSYQNRQGMNTVVGPDLVWRPNAQDRIRGQALFSSTSAIADDNGNLQAGKNQSGNYIFADWIRKTDAWEPSLTFEQVSDKYRNDTGFVPQSSYRQITGQIQRKWQFDSAWHEVDAYLWVTNAQTLDGITISRILDPGVYISGPRNTSLNLEFHPGMAQRVKPGGKLHNFSQWFMTIEANPFDWLNHIGSKLTLGEQVDIENDRVGRGLSLELSAKMRLFDRIEIEPYFSKTSIQGSDGKIALNDKVARILGVVHFSAQDALRGIFQRQSTERHASSSTNGVPASSSNYDTCSMIFSHKTSAANVWYLGLTKAHGQGAIPANARSSEMFFKLQFGI
jgi:hypothetical protein